MNINENGFNIWDIVKFTFIGLICSLLLGFLLYYSTQFTIYQYSLMVSTGLTVLAFPAAVMISVILLSAYMRAKNDALVMGLLVGVLTGLLQSGVITIFMGKLKSGWFDDYIGNQIFLLIILGIIAAYLGYAYLKPKIHQHNIEKLMR